MEYYDLGVYSLSLSTASPEAQIWFDRGLNWTFGYNHAEAVVCFRRALDADPACAMAHWGVAYASAPNYNMPPWELFDADGRAEALAAAHDATQAALANVDAATRPEAALIRALPVRYPQRTPTDDIARWNDAFADAMRDALARHPEHLEVRAVFAEALLNRMPWKMWDLATGGGRGRAGVPGSAGGRV